MEKRRGIRKEENRQSILRAALYEFANKGYTNASLAAIAQRAGVSYGLVSQDFGSKEELYRALISHSYRLFRERCDLEGTFFSHFMRLIHEIKKDATADTLGFKFLSMQLTNKDCPHDSVYWMRDEFHETRFYKVFSEAMEQGIIPGSSPAYVILNFFKSAVAITKAYVDMALDPPADIEYMRLIGWKIDPEKQYEMIAEDEELSRTREAESLKHVMRNNMMFQILASEYTGLYYVNLETDELDIYSMSERVKKDIGGILNRKLDKSKMFHQYVDELVHPDDKHKMLDAFDNISKYLAHHKSFTLYFRRNYDGEYLYTEMYCVKIDDENSPATEITVGFVEKDKQYHSDMESMRLKQQNQEVIETLVSQFDAVYFYDFSEGRFAPYLTSPMAAQVFGERLSDGVPLEELVKMFTECIVYPADRDKIRAIAGVEQIREKLADRKSLEIVFRRRDEYGIRYSMMQIIKLNRENETPTAVAVAFKYNDDDIIGHYINEKFIEEYTSIYFIDLENDMIRAYKESDITDTGRFVTGNYHAAAQMFAKHVAPEYKSMWENFADPGYIRHFMGDENSREFVYEVEGSKNIWRRGVLQVVERKENIPVTLIISFVSIDRIAAEKLQLDAKIAEQKMALESQQGQLELALEKAEAANKAKTAFLSNMSHDIRTPMNAIMGFTNLALDNIDDSEKVKDYLLKTSLSSKHLLSLINDILDMSRIESGKTTINNDSMDMRLFADNCRSVVMGLMSDRDLHYEATIDKLSHPVVLGDELHLRQVLINILGNAIKYTLDGGRIDFRMRELSVEDDIVTYQLEVEDNGIGMKPEYVEHIFEAFSQEAGGARTQYKGTGLGMAITKKLVDMMGGTIEVNSTYEVGSRFTLNIPFRIDHGARITQHVEMRRDIKGARVLLVEDNELNREIAAEILKDAKAECEFAENGQEAVDMFAQHDQFYYDIILMDIMMPVMDGLEAARHIRAMDRPDAELVPIIAMTANAFDEDMRKSREAGMNAHVAKPIDTGILIKTMATYYHRNDS